MCSDGDGGAVVCWSAHHLGFIDGVQSNGHHCRRESTAWPSQHTWPSAGCAPQHVQQDASPPPASPQPPAPAQQGLPCGTKTTINQRKSMEDFYSVNQKFMQLPLSVADSQELIPDYVRQLEAYSRTANPAAAPWSAAVQLLRPAYPSGVCVLDDFHLFCVFDGHGGADVSRHCATFLHEHLRHALTSTLQESHPGIPALTGAANPKQISNTLNKVCADEPMCDSSEDTHYGLVDECMGEGEESGGCAAGAADVGLTTMGMAASMVRAFEEIDREVEAGGRSSYQGSTAVSALVGTWHICVAGVGDSRAVLFRAGAAIRMTRDHKPADEDEMSRIHSLGGQVLTIKGCARVQGILAMSRAIGDNVFPCVSASPE
eukprot:evm.model.scf_4246.1 EVM.evm.TU.scf_4246.1   scf_4246:1211-3609(+)